MDPSEIEVKRDGQQQTFTVQPTVPRLISDIGPNKPLAVDSLGIAIPMDRTVDWIEPGSSAARSSR